MPTSGVGTRDGGEGGGQLSAREAAPSSKRGGNSREGRHLIARGMNLIIRCSASVRERAVAQQNGGDNYLLGGDTYHQNG